MKAHINKESTYFCFDSYSTAGRPKMEEALFDLARRNVLHHTIEGSVVNNLLEDLAHAQEHQRHRHPDALKRHQLQQLELDIRVLIHRHFGVIVLRRTV